MVYCGKASQGCQNCRTRRIKVCSIDPLNPLSGYSEEGSGLAILLINFVAGQNRPIQDRG